MAAERNKKWEAENKIGHSICIPPNIMYRTNTLHVPLVIEHLAIAGEECFICCLVLPFTERHNFIQLAKKHIIVLYLQIFNARSYDLFTISASGLFLKHS